MSALVKHELIEHATFTQAFSRLETVIKRGLAGEALILPIFGPTRVGKTELVKTVMDDYPVSVVEGVRQMPVVRVVTPVNPTRRSLPVAVLEGLGCPRYSRSSSEELTRIARELMKMTGTRVLILDEMQHFIERGSRTAAREAADWLKVLSEEMNLTLVLIGLPAANEVLTRNEQLRDRSEATFEFRPYDWNDPSEQREFRRALLSITQAFSEAGWEMPNAMELDYARRVYGASLGRIGMLVKLFLAVEHLAQRQTVTDEVLAKAFNETINTNFLEFNPFVDKPPVDSLLGQGYARMLLEAGMAVRKRSKKGDAA